MDKDIRAKYVRVIRTHYGHTQVQIAKLLNISEWLYKKIEAGEEIKYKQKEIDKRVNELMIGITSDFLRDSNVSREKKKHIVMVILAISLLVNIALLFTVFS